jgi:predicted permease
MIQDLRYAMRALLRAPAFAISAVLTLAIGIAVNTIVFTLLNSLALRPMPVRDASHVVRVFPIDDSGRRRNLFSYRDLLDYRADATGFEGLTAYVPLSVTVRIRGADAEDIIGYAVTSNYFALLGLEPSLGRAFLPSEERSGAESAVAVIGHTLWRRYFGSDPAVIGASLVINDRTFTVIGVGPERFGGTEPLAPDVWVPIGTQSTVAPGADLLNDRGAPWLLVAGRLKPGVSRDAAGAPLNVVAQRLAADHPAPGRPVAVEVAAGAFFPVDPALRPLILLVLCIVGLVLAIAAANVANLILARTTSRQRELAVRLAMGATRWRLVRQLVTESLAIGLLGGAAGLLLSVWTLRFLYPIGLSLLPFAWGAVVLDLSPDVRVFAYTVAIALGAGILLGLAPALQASTPHLAGALHDDGAMIGGRMRRSRLRQALVIVQIAVSLVLLVGAGLLARGLYRARSLDLGFDTAGVVFTRYDLRRHGYTAERAAGLNALLVDTAAAARGVTAVALTSHVPLDGGVKRTTVSLEGSGARVECTTTTVTASYFDAMKIPVIAGRAFADDESRQGAPVAMISEGLAARFWPGVDPIGRQLAADGLQVPLTILGVVRDASHALWRDKAMSLYLPLGPASDPRDVHLLVRTSEDPAPLVMALRQRVRALDRGLTFTATPLDSLLALWILPSRIAAIAAAVLGCLALVLASVGLYGVMAYTVSDRTREIGIRMALGARAADVRRLVLAEGGRLIAIGIAAGLAGAVVLGRMLRRFVFDVSALDPLTFVVIPVCLCAVALGACYFPARRASRVEPLVAMRTP